MSHDFKVGEWVRVINNPKRCCVITKIYKSVIYGNWDNWESADEIRGSYIAPRHSDTVERFEWLKSEERTLTATTATKAAELRDKEIEASWDSIGDIWAKPAPDRAEPLFGSIERNTWPGAGVQKGIGEYAPGPACEDEVCADEFKRANKELKGLKEHINRIEELRARAEKRIEQQAERIAQLEKQHALTLADHAEEIRQLSSLTDGMFS